MLALVWLLSWLPIGFWVGDFDFVLTRVSRGTHARQLYQFLLYGGLLFVFADSWRRHRPTKPSWGNLRQFGFYFVQGLVASIVLRVMLGTLGLAGWVFPSLGAFQIVSILLSCLAVAMVEEAVFRGFLLGTLVKKLGWPAGVTITSLIFALVHLFRPGSLGFKALYGLGLFLLGYLLARIAYHHDSILASAGFHGGVILLNLTLVLESFEPSYLAGWSREPVSGMMSIGLTAMFLLAWHALRHRLPGFLEPKRSAPCVEDKGL